MTKISIKLDEELADMEDNLDALSEYVGYTKDNIKEIRTLLKEKAEKTE